MSAPMKVLRGAAILIAVLVVALLAYALANALYTTRPVGFQKILAADGGGAPLAIGVWYPTDGRPWPTTMLGGNLMSVAGDAPVAGSALPFVVISHGNGGGPGSHVDLALALAQQGFVVAAPMHTGDNFADQSAVGSARWLVDRNRHMRAAIDHMLTVWPARDRIDAGRVGAFGFSAGGFTALTAIGGVPNLQGLASHCSTAPEFVCKLLAEARSPLLTPSEAPPPGAFARDARIRAAAIAAPGLGFTFMPNGLANVSVPVQLWSGDADQNVPTSSNAGPVAKALASRAELRDVPGAGHFAFLAPCGLFGPPVLCRDANDFDRRRFHAQMNAAVVKFFEEKL
jgi:predicted dienelactone hydrolase